MAHVIIRDGLVNEAFVAGRTDNFAALATAVQDWTPERAAIISGVPPTRLLPRHMCTPRPTPPPSFGQWALPNTPAAPTTSKH
ncbi:MAG: hypothetical protein R3E31_14070 [Chloroflexota bacterium]